MHTDEEKFLDSIFPQVRESYSSKGNLPQLYIRGCYLTMTREVIPVFSLSNLSKQTYSENGVLQIMNN